MTCRQKEGGCETAEEFTDLQGKTKKAEENTDAPFINDRTCSKIKKIF
jgi:hypothetical protein